MTKLKRNPPAKKAPSKAAGKEAPVKRKRSPWNTAEILYSVIGYLTTRETPLILSGHHDAAPVAEIVGAIVKANDLPATRPGKAWPKITIPEGLENITNMPPKPMQAVNTAAPDPVAAALTVIRQWTPAEQNEIVKRILKELHTDRQNHLSALSQDRKVLEENTMKAERDFKGFLSAVTGAEN